VFLLNSLATFTTLATPPVKAPRADNPAKIGMSGSTPPFFGIFIVRGTFVFLVLNVFCATATHFLVNFIKFFSPTFFFITFLVALSAALKPQPPPIFRFAFMAVVTPQATAFSFKLESFDLNLSQARCSNI